MGKDVKVIALAALGTVILLALLCAAFISLTPS